MALVLKTRGCKSPGGSNPSLSSRKKEDHMATDGNPLKTRLIAIHDKLNQYSEVGADLTPEETKDVSEFMDFFLYDGTENEADDPD